MGISISGLVSGASSSFNALSSLGQNTGLTLGSFKFANFEIPAELNFGAQAQMTVHKLPGGRRIIDQMGIDQHDLEWKGVFLSGNADTRLKSLSKLRQDAKPITLTWGSFSETVVIADLKYTYKKRNHIEYSIVCKVSPKPQTSLDATKPGGWLASIRQAANDVTSAISDIEDQVTQAISPITDAISEVSSVVSPVLAGLGISSPLLNSLFDGINNISSAGLLSAAFSTASNMNALDGALSASQATVATIAASSGYTLSAVSANATSEGAISSTTPSRVSALIANAPAPSANSPLVYSIADLNTASAALGAQETALTTNAQITLARRDLIVQGQVQASVYPNLQTVTNDLYSATVPTSITLSNGQIIVTLPSVQIVIPPIVTYVPPTIVYIPPPANTGGVSVGNGGSTTSPSNPSNPTNPTTTTPSNPTTSTPAPTPTPSPVMVPASDGVAYAFSDGVYLLFSDSSTSAIPQNAYQFTDGTYLLNSDGTIAASNG